MKTVKLVLNIIFIVLIVFSSSIIFHEAYHWVVNEDPHLICFGVDTEGHLGAVISHSEQFYDPQEEFLANVLGLLCATLLGTLYVLKEVL